MPLGEIGAILLVLIVVFILGQIWFHFIESILDKIKSLFKSNKKTPEWHTLPDDWEDKDCK